MLEKENADMVRQTITVTNQSGLHLRPAGFLVKEATKCNSEVIICYNENRINAKSVLNIMASGIKCGTEITIECEGETEQKDLEIIITAIKNGLGESRSVS